MILWCYNNYQRYPNLFWLIKHTVTVSTYVGLYYLCMFCYRAAIFTKKYGAERTRQILQLSDTKSLYQRYGNTINGERSWAVVTGGTDGLGYKISKILAKQGFNICLLARNQEKANVCLQKIKYRTSDSRLQLKSIIVDLAKMSTIQDYKEQVAQQLKGIDIGLVVLAAGTAEEGEFSKIEAERVQDQVRVNALSPTYILRCL